MSHMGSFEVRNLRTHERIRSHPAEVLLTFSQFKSRFATTYSSSEIPVYDPSLERFPDDEWYTLAHDKINTGIQNMCTPLLQAIQNHSRNDAEVSSLESALQAAKTIPQSQQFYVAFLGEQGMGKSSLSNSVLGRDLVPVSSSSSACTAYATIITHQAGASDDTSVSNVRTEYLTDAEIRECTEEQVRRYRYAFPCKARPGADTGLAGEPEISSFETELEDEGSDAGDEENNLEEEEEEISNEDDEEEESDDEANNTPAPSLYSRKAVPPSVFRGAKTAKLFLEIIFGTHQSKQRKNALLDDLEYADLEQPGFISLCVEQARERLRGNRTPSGFSACDELDDELLEDYHEVTSRIWPLVKSVHIATGHVLLRNNVCIMDLPGYGDDNHIRTALIDRFREKAHFEIVVVPTSRVVSSVVQKRYLNRSLRRLGARNTLLVTNKSDQLFDSVPIQKLMKRLREEPFPMVREYLTDLEAIDMRSNEDRDLVRAYRNYLIKEAREAYIKREGRIISSSLDDTDVDILSVSARQYSLCLEEKHDEDDHEPPKLTPEATGVPQLRRYLFHLPAQTNYRTLHYHVFETLPDVMAQIRRILEKFDDEGFSEMRGHLAEQLPLICKSAQALARSLPTERTARPFNGPGEKASVNTALGSVVQSFRAPNIYYPTFAKMLKENGIPVNGAGLGRNLNEMILNGMVGFIDLWHTNMQNETESIAAKLDEPIQAVLRALRKHCDGYTGDPELKKRAFDLFETASRRIRMAYGKLAAQLQSKLRDIYILYTTETNTQCPIALEMKEIYRDVLLKQYKQLGSGSYARLRTHLLDSLIHPDWPKNPLSNSMEQKIYTAQVGLWKQCCKDYVTQAMTLLRDFSRAIDELHDNGALLTSQHRRVRKQLERFLPEFRSQLTRIQAQFSGTQTARSPTQIVFSGTATNKRKADDERAATQPPTSKPDVLKRVKTAFQQSQSRAILAQPMLRPREGFLVRAGLKHALKPVVKREWSP